MYLMSRRYICAHAGLQLAISFGNNLIFLPRTPFDRYSLRWDLYDSCKCTHKVYLCRVGALNRTHKLDEREYLLINIIDKPDLSFSFSSFSPSYLSISIQSIASFLRNSDNWRETTRKLLIISCRFIILLEDRGNEGRGLQDEQIYRISGNRNFW